MNFTCNECNDTGSSDKSGDYLDCGYCDAAMQRKAMNDFLDKLPAMGDYDAAWLVHQRALAMAPKQEALVDERVAFIAEYQLNGTMLISDDAGGFSNPWVNAHWDGWQRRARFAAPAAANGALTDEQILAIIWKYSSFISVGNYSSTQFDCQTDMLNCIRAILAAAGPDAALVALIHKAQMILAHHLPPDGPDAKTTISALLGLLDGPESRAALKPYGDA